MQRAKFPSPRVKPKFRAEAEGFFAGGEPPSEFVARGLQARDEARASGHYVDADAVVDSLQRKLDAASAALKRRGR